MEVINKQTIGFLHSDKEHRHLHLVINKVRDPRLKLYHDGFIGKRTQKVADRIAIEMKLIRAIEIRNQNIQNKKKHKRDTELIAPYLNPDHQKISQQSFGSKQLFKQALKEIFAKANVRSIEDYFDEVQKAGFKVLQYHNKETKELRGYGIKKNKTKMDASAIGKEFTLNNLNIHFANMNLKNTRENPIVNFDEKQEKIIRRGVRI